VPSKNEPSAVARHIREARQARHWSQWELAIKSGITTTTISRTECSTTMPKLPTLEKIAQGFGCTVTDLLDGDGDDPEPPGP
jgi:transcriptional regulator with XRE-family HTH domain